MLQRWQRPGATRRRRRIGGFLCLLIVSGSATATILALARSSASQTASSDWVEVRRDDDTGMELILRAPALERRGRELHVPGFAWSGEPGMPIEFQRAALVAVPGPGGAVLEILEEDTQREVDVVAPRLPLGTAADPMTLAWSGPRPTASVALVPGGRVRGRDVVTLVYTPLVFETNGSATYARTVHVRLRFTARPRVGGTVPPAPEPLHGACLNAATAARWPLQFEVRKIPAAAVAALPDRRVRLRIARTGLYAIDYTRLRNVLGDAELGALDPTTLQVYVDTWAPVPLRADSIPASWQSDYALQEIAIWVQGEENHSFDTQDRIVFYALGPEDYMDLTGLRADSLLHGQNPYDNVQYAWLVWGAQPGARAANVAASEPGTPPDLVRRSWYRLHYEADAQFGTVDDLWFWDEIRSNNPFFTMFEADLGEPTNPAALLRIGIGATDYYRTGNHAVRVRLGTQDLGDIRWSQPVSKPANHYATFPVTLGTSNDLRMSLVEWTISSPSDPTQILKFDLTWDRPLVLPGRGPEAGRLRWSRRPVAADEAYELSGFTGTSPWFLDVTEPLRPTRLTDPSAAGTPGVWRLRYGRGTGVRTHFLAVSSPTLLDAGDLTPRTVRPLRNPTSVPDMVVITHASLVSQAQRLAQHRAAHFPAATTLGHGPDVQVVDVADIYDNFAGGRSDPLAIRNYLKLLYTQPLAPGETAPRLRYALLFGEATHDPRRLAPGSTPTLVPTVHAWYADPMDAGRAQLVPQHLRRWYAVEDWLGEMDMPRAAGLANVHPLPDLGVGRLTPRTLAEAQRLVDKIIDYDLSTDFDAWRTRVVLSADDECKLGDCGETEHVDGMEQLVPWTPAEWDIVKIYLTEYPATLGQKPQGRAAFIRTWSEGCALVCYQGHGAPRQLADEVLFLSTDIPALTNGRRLPVFMAYSCTVAEFDAPELQSMCEDLITSAAGGAIAAMGATVVTFASPNADYNVAIWRDMFADGATSKVPFGTMHQLAKNRSPLFDGLNNEKYVLMGDPAMTLLAPEALVAWTSGADSLEAGRSTRVEAFVHLPGETTPLAAFDGTADVEVLGTADESGYQSATPPHVRIRYDLPGPPLYRGRVSVRGGRFGFQFVVPLGAKLGSKARLSAYVANTATGADAKGADGTVRVVSAAQPDSSLGPPRIALYFPNNVTKVKPGTVLVGEIRDENGINIQGTALPSSILLDFDDRNQPLNVTSQFRYADGSDSVGTVSVPLPEGMAPGPHKATMIASDNLQNRSTQSLEFDVVPASTELMANVIAFPNPFKDRTYFFFELTDPSDVLVRVFSAAGREVWRTEQFVDTPQQVSIRWDGIDFAQDPVANGTYLYRVEARPRRSTAGDGPVLKHVGKVVVMRD